MTQGSDNGSPPFDGKSSEPQKRWTTKQFEEMIREAAGHPEQVTALVRRMVLQTIEEVRENLDQPEPAN